MTAAPLAIPHSLDDKQREELRSFLAALAGGQTLVLRGSRGDETWLARDPFAGNVYRLVGLDPEAASDLADAVLQRAGAQSRRQEGAFKELMALLAGYPLALQVVLPHLAAKAAATVLDELRGGLADVDAVPGSDPILARTRSLMACIEYSHGHLDPAAQALLACFAPFTGVINEALLEGLRRFRRRPQCQRPVRNKLRAGWGWSKPANCASRCNRPRPRARSSASPSRSSGRPERIGS